MIMIAPARTRKAYHPPATRKNYNPHSPALANFFKKHPQKPAIFQFGFSLFFSCTNTKPFIELGLG